MDPTPKVDIEELETELRRIPGINAVRVVLSPEHHPVEIHVLGGGGKPAKQVVRDVQTVAKAVFDLDIDRRIISVVQMDGNLVTVDEIRRVMVEGISRNRTGNRSTTEVTLRRGVDLATGLATGMAASATALTLVARATLAGLAKLDVSAEQLEVEGIGVQRLGDRTYVVCSLILLSPPYEEILLGAAMVRAAGDEDAAARAVLAATNRRLALAD
ncbi:MAG TPA: hypothetical protein VFA94_09900 [Acidimicrobiales bacterium]|nr:hypothetical protein [Acidimicrobiales bacterium]